MDKIALHGDLKKNLGDRKDLYLIGGEGIATKEQYLAFLPGVGHCFGDTVKAHGAIIGSRDEIEILTSCQDDYQL